MSIRPLVLTAAVLALAPSAAADGASSTVLDLGAAARASGYPAW